MDTKITLTAHRGYRQKFPENTMISFREALKLDIDSIETDVRMTNDHQIVVIHDQTLQRTTDKEGHVCDRSLAEVREADAGIKFGEQFKGEKVPMLTELLELLKDRKDVKLLLELKDYPEEYGNFAYASCEESLRLCKEYGVWGKDRLTIITFSTALCAWIRRKHAGEDITIHGFYPKAKMKGSDSDDPYKYIDEVCIFSTDSGVYPDGRPSWRTTGTSFEDDKLVYDTFKMMGIKPCVYYSWNTDEKLYERCAKLGAIGFTCDDAYTCGKILDKLGLRKLRNKD